MSQRILVVLVALPIIVPLVLWGGIWSTLLVLAMCWGGGYEFYSLMDKAGLRPARWFGLFWITLFLLFYAHPLWAHLLPANQFTLTTVLSLGLIVLFIRVLFQEERPLYTWFSTAGGAVYIGILSGQIAALRLLDTGLWWIVLAVIITWANDSVAYFVGVYFGKHPLWPRLSPKKTWEGTIGGWLGASLAGVLFYLLFAPTFSLSLWTTAALGFVGGVLALFGDLSISMLKRQIGVKDTGKIFPGHGGMLDRMDSLLFVLPYIYQVALLFRS